jgi:replicative DNA helicase
MSDKVKEAFCRPTDERALLHFALRDMDQFYAITSKMTENDFLYKEHSNLLVLLKSFHMKGAEEFDLTAVAGEAHLMGMLDSIGGYDYLRSIYDMSASKPNFDMHMECVFEASTKYQLYSHLQRNVQEVMENARDGLSSDDLIGCVEGTMLDLASSSKAIREPRALSDGLREVIESRRVTPIPMIGLPTGYPILDTMIDGMIDGTLHVIAARPKMGKSTFLSNVSLQVAIIQKKPVLYVDTEMSYEQWRDRAVATVSGLEEREIKHGGYSKEAYLILKRAMDKIEKHGQIYHEFMPGYSVDKLVALYKRFKAKHDIGLMVFDYIKEPDSSSTDRQRKEYQILGDVTTKLKDLSGELVIPAFTAIQLNRDNKVADSDRIDRYGDIIMHWMNRTKEEREHSLHGSNKLIIKRSRRGGATSDEGIAYYFFKKTAQIREVAMDKQLMKSSLLTNTQDTDSDNEVDACVYRGVLGDEEDGKTELR